MNPFQNLNREDFKEFMAFVNTSLGWVYLFCLLFIPLEAQNERFADVGLGIVGAGFVGGLSGVPTAGVGAVAGGAFANVQDAVESMVPPPSATVFPVGNQVEPYNLLFAEYRHLVDLFGRNAQSMLRRLRTLQRL